MLVLPLGGAAWAQAGAACVPGGTQEQVNACALRDFQAADVAMGVAYSDAMQALPAAERARLRREHSAWMQQRNATCKQATRAFEQQPDGPRRYHECLTEQTQERRHKLRPEPPASP
ncbi:lysozyme inhibitor LprI family protein [Pseudorhodoferax sp. Leaf267]|uniref:lysozyme inhibitor LprI family protein n=1 Tax=Pseudorhodoferax sp. Leaf267 TaxID=1736316 RepID=UPI0006F8FBF1|nr:lysozyme inhibitor LprI family protein [Pseudorhodoferax sp. Leaf267]KQP15211.1 hypothetical protein ASF43_12935 [Pseudorhodoferax sp. Leaf267]